MYVRHFLIEGKHYGTVTDYPFLRDGVRYQPHSYAYFCPCCGSQWAVSPVDTTSSWACVTRPCRKHQGTHWDAAGSLSLPGAYAKDYNSSFPLAVLHWELLREIDFYEALSK